MKKLYFFIFVIVGFLCAQIPKTLSYQGVLTNAGGEALEGKHLVTFNFYESAEGGKTLWNESHTIIIAEGFFEAILGSRNPLNLPFNKPYWLGITVDDSQELSPRIQLNASPYSLVAETVSDSSITKQKIAKNQVVKSINSITDNLTITAGENVKITQKNDTLIISAIQNRSMPVSKDNFSDKNIMDSGNYHRVETLNGLDGKINIKTRGGASIWEKDGDTIYIMAGKGNIERITNEDSTLTINNPEGKYIKDVGRVTTLDIKKGSISESFLADYAVTTLKIAPEAVNSMTIKDSSIVSADLAENAVANINLQDNSITGDKIYEGAVDSKRLADGAVTSAKIKNGAVTQAKLDPSVALPAGGPAGGDLEGTFPNPSIKASAVNSSKIADGSVGEVDLAVDAVSTTKIIDGAVTGAKIADNSITQSDLADNAVTTAKIADQAITQSKLDPAIAFPASGSAGGDLQGTYPNPIIRAAAVTSEKIADGSIVEVDLADNAVSGAKIADGTIGQGDLAVNAVNASKIAPGSVIKSVNNLKDDITLAAGSNVSITQNGNILTFSSATAFDNDWTIAGNNMFSGVGGNVGIGLINPAQKLDVNGVVKMSGFQMPQGAVNDYVLTSDGQGMGSWMPLPSAGLSGTGSPGFLPVFDSQNSISNSSVYESNQKIGIGNTSPVAKLDVNTVNDVYSGRFLNQRLSVATHVIHAEYNGSSGNQNVIAVYGKSEPNDAYGYGGYFQAGRFGVSGFVYPSGNSSYIGTRGYVNGGSGINYALHGFSRGQNTNIGALGSASGASPNAVNYGIYGTASGQGTNYAGYFAGTLYANVINGGTKNFKIDHPMDPENKYLYHSSVESAEMINIYNGNVTLDKNGEAWVYLPEWFEVINKDFRYQLTCIGGFAQVYIAEKISNNRFKIAGGNMGLEVSWQVTGVRNDPVAVKNRMQVVQEKAPVEKGKYLDPAAYGLPETMGIGYEALKKLEDNEDEIRQLRNQ